MSLNFLTAGESHGPALVGILEGFWSNFEIDESKINSELARRQSGYGRGGRMKIEGDTVNFLGGVRQGVTTGAPIAFQIFNKDYQNWKDEMNPSKIDSEESSTKQSESQSKFNTQVTKPRPGHADLAGALKYDQSDIRNILERSSARETAMRTAVGSLCKQLLQDLNIKIISHVTRIGSISLSQELTGVTHTNNFSNMKELISNLERSQLNCIDPKTEQKMIEEIDSTRLQGDTLGGEFEVIVENLPPGLGSHVHYHRKLDGLLAGALMGLQGIKGVEIGAGFQTATLPGSQIHDEIFYSQDRGYYRDQNNAGGVEGGISNGEPVIVRGAMKPIPTLSKPLKSVDIHTKEAFDAQIERSDCCAVPSAAIVAEHIIAYELAKVVKEKFGSDSIDELRRNYQAYFEYLDTR